VAGAAKLNFTARTAYTNARAVKIGTMAQPSRRIHLAEKINKYYHNPLKNRKLPEVIHV
jgi:hypothetical protein